jgi:hypothetical protein
MFLYSCIFNTVSSSDPIREILLHLCTIQQRYSIHTKEEKPHDRTTSYKLSQYTVFYEIALYIHPLYIIFFYLYFFYLFIFITYFILSLNTPVIFYILICYTGWSKSLCAPDDCIVIIRWTETFLSPCSNHVNKILYFLKRQLCKKNFLASWKKPKHVAAIIS